MAQEMVSYAAKLVGIHFRESHYIFISSCRDSILTDDEDRASFRFIAEFRSCQKSATEVGENV